MGGPRESLLNHVRITGLNRGPCGGLLATLEVTWPLWRMADPRRVHLILCEGDVPHLRPACWDKTRREADRPKVEANWPLPWNLASRPGDVETGWPYVVAVWLLSATLVQYGFPRILLVTLAGFFLI
jgi:hypothetical protein